jgi:colanic acid/amylovoran biosynthesis glycosyltransferase
MKIAFFTRYFPKVSETFIINQVTNLIDRGHDVTVFASKKPDENVIHDSVAEYDLFDRTVYSEKPSTYLEGIRLLGKFSGVIATKYPSHLREIQRSLKLGREAPARLANFHRFMAHDEIFDLCHAHFGTVGRQWEFVADLPEQGPFVTTCYGTDVTGFPHPNRYDWYDGFWERCDLAIGITQYIRSRMIMLGCPEKKSIKHPIGIDTTRFDWNMRTYDGGPLRIVSVARHAKKKGLRYGIEAVADCIDAGMDIEYQIAGDGELRPELERLVRQRGISDEVNLLGWIPQSEVSQILQESHLFMLPSVTARSGDTEGQALVLQEAQATGVPVIATYHDGIPEGVAERWTGRLVPEREPESLADAIKFFHDNPEIVQEYSRNTADYIERFDNKRLLDRQVDLYRNLVEQA